MHIPWDLLHPCQKHLLYGQLLLFVPVLLSFYGVYKMVVRDWKGFCSFLCHISSFYTHILTFLSLNIPLPWDIEPHSSFFCNNSVVCWFQSFWFQTFFTAMKITSMELYGIENMHFKSNVWFTNFSKVFPVNFKVKYEGIYKHVYKKIQLPS